MRLNLLFVSHMHKTYIKNIREVVASIQKKIKHITLLAVLEIMSVLDNPQLDTMFIKHSARHETAKKK